MLPPNPGSSYTCPTLWTGQRHLHPLLHFIFSDLLSFSKNSYYPHFIDPESLRAWSSAQQSPQLQALSVRPDSSWPTVRLTPPLLPYYARKRGRHLSPTCLLLSCFLQDPLPSGHTSAWLPFCVLRFSLSLPLPSFLSSSLLSHLLKNTPLHSSSLWVRQISTKNSHGVMDEFCPQGLAFDLESGNWTKGIESTILRHSRIQGLASDLLSSPSVSMEASLRNSLHGLPACGIQIHGSQDNKQGV